MADKTKIEWTDATWNPITGCAVVSPGCTNCYAMKLAGTRLQHHPSRAGLTRDTRSGPVWTSEVRFNEQWLDQPPRWRKPRMIFVCAHGDLFAEGVPDKWIDKVFAVMALAPQHTFQVLTKRADRMRDYCDSITSRSGAERIATAAAWIWGGKNPDGIVDGIMVEIADQSCLPNVWLGVSVEDQARADERIPLLLDTPAAVRWISAEPLLAPIELRRLSGRREGENFDAMAGAFWEAVLPNRYEPISPPLNSVPSPTHRQWTSGAGPRVDWVVAGGESGSGARPMHPDWARSLRDQCAAAGVPLLFKQWGEWLPFSQCRTPEQRETVSRTTRRSNETGNGDQTYFGKTIRRHPDGHFVTSTTPGLRPEQINRVGKKVAGRVLDGVVHDAMPEVAR
ncbi:DUF5131 family protein [uncultured Jannaschia sp.]|uniref:DUF5131 family protein n=1 Tax=uncultured Jannaschia sp. TaxID=293347 RepID=UPI002628388C|nr:phage Gp37/Gp68 family protein [uncultured Jannaschia sp.]